MAKSSFPQLGDVDVVEVYEFYDEPVLFVCKDRTDVHYLVVLSEETPSHKAWLLSPLSAARHAEIRSGARDLHSAFADSERGQILKVCVPRQADGNETSEWVRTVDLRAEELPLRGERLELHQHTSTPEPIQDERRASPLLDNRVQARVFDALARELDGASELAIITSDFSVFAALELSAALQGIKQTRLLLSLSSPGTTAPPPAALLLGGPEERRYRNRLTAAHAARACASWIERCVDVAGIDAPVPHSLYLISRGQTQTAIHGSSPFTAPGLGLVPALRHEMNTHVTGVSRLRELRSHFDRLWSNSGAEDVKARMLGELDRISSSKSARTIYFTMLHALFESSLDRLDEEEIVKSKTGIRETLVWQKLYRFQRDGVVSAIDKIERYNGCIIADSVGLGKTFEALAVIKYYELRNDRVLVLCPKKLRDNWTTFTVNDKRNVFASDRFNYDVLNHTDLTRPRGRSGEINLETLNWGNYDLVVIDESHNFRNNPPKKDGLTRYKKLMQGIIRAGVKTRVLMLSATPVNSRMNDLKNQVAFITEGVDDALDGAGIVSVEQTLRKAQGRFNQWLKREPDARTTTSLLESLNFDYFKLLDLLTIARSRKHIEKYYDLSEIGSFPTRSTPRNIRADIDTADLFPPLRNVNRDIRRLTLSAYAPMRYVLPTKLKEYSRQYDMEVAGGRTFRQSDREESLIHLMRVNLLKRMESSIHSFAKTVAKLLSKVSPRRSPS